ncbi:hypothetical protein ABIE09_002516 [Lysobacter enzymogenes]|uniref:hypothetical protein n=1 Tax=Lysobacter enzymogenes TaxID=69 RepID=UPI00339349FA
MDAQRNESIVGHSFLRERAWRKFARDGLWALALMCCVAGAAVARQRQYVVESFAKGDFVARVYDQSKRATKSDSGSTVYDQSELVRAYGPGWVSVENGMQYRWYRDAGSDRWLRLASDMDAAPFYRIIDEMLVLSFGPARAVAGRTESLGAVGLFGVTLGSPADAAVKAAKSRHWLRRGPMRLLGQRVEEIEFLTRGRDDGMIYRYYLREGKVVGLSVGVTE